MARYQFYSQGKLRSLTVQPVSAMKERVRAAPKAFAAGAEVTRGGGVIEKGVKRKGVTASRERGAKAVANAMAQQMTRSVDVVHAQNERLGELFHATGEADLAVIAPKPDEPTALVTDTLIVDAATKAEVAWLRDKFGLEELRAGLQGKVLLKSPEGGDAGKRILFEAAKAAYERGHVAAAHPNFVRLLPGVKLSSAGNQPLWNHDNTGNPGLAGSDVAAKAAWIITRGRPEFRVAVLDEGVDTDHPALKAAVVAEKDFVDGNAHARPDGNDAHGTACAGIIVSRDSTYPGLAPECSLVAVRLAKGDGQGNWVFDEAQDGLQGGANNWPIRAPSSLLPRARTL
jgi:subtilisin family serine protease